MGFSYENLIRSRPFAFHNSCRENFEAIRRRGMLLSTARMLKGTPHEDLLKYRRKSSALIELGEEKIVIRDHKPLRPGSVEFLGGWQLSDMIAELNSRVFLWPGTDGGPIRRGRSHFNRYAAKGSVFTIRMSTRSLLAANRDRKLWVTRCNSGSARHHQGKPVQRGPQTFKFPETATFSPAKVIELSYIDSTAKR